MDNRRRTGNGVDEDLEACEMAIDGASEDEILKNAEALTREELVRRRARRVKQLMKLYRVQYWSLLEEMRSKYRLFYLRSGKSGWRDEEEEKEGDGLQEMDASSGENPKCGVQGCKRKPLPLSIFCFSHILLEPKQQLYKPCTYLIRSGQMGSVTCGRPVLQAVTPCLCAIHFQHAQKQAARALKKANNNPSCNAGVPTIKTPPKLHIVISTYVRLIQEKRRAVLAQSGKPVHTCKEEIE